jgi:hypothetical protein
MSATNDPIADGKAAWQRLKTNERTSWADWVLIARALEIGRGEARKMARADAPVGSKYNAEMGRWLREHDLADIPAQARYRAVQCLKRLPEIERWREGLTDKQRSSWNHPNAIWQHFQHSPKTETTLFRQHVVTTVTAKTGRRGTNVSIRWPQTVLQRAAAAIREARSNDCIILAKAALMAAIRDERDILELLPDPPPAKPAPRQSIREAAPAAIEVHA